MRLTRSQCWNCKHLRRLDDGTELSSCAAFEAIPLEILGLVSPGGSIHDHRQPFPGDNGIRFEALPGRRHLLDIIDPNPEATDGPTPRS